MVVDVVAGHPVSPVAVNDNAKPPGSDINTWSILNVCPIAVTRSLTAKEPLIYPLEYSVAPVAQLYNL